MQATKQQQIMGYFIEEAKEHLDTIEQGLLSLKATMADSERLNELFRAAHSVKGGAAMLGLSSIQKVGHHLEDCFKLLKETPVEIDRHLEDLFLKGFDTLKELVEALQSPYGLREVEAAQKIQAAEPIFIELQTYLDHRMRSNGTATSQTATSQSIPTPAVTSTRTDAELATLLNGALRKMLELFKQGDRLAGRQQLAVFCSRMAQLHPSPNWQELLQSVQAAIANGKTPYQTLAPLIIRELKLASDLLLAGRSEEIISSQSLKQLAPSHQPAPAQVSPPPSTPQEQIPTKPQQITIPAEPRAAARVLLTTFNKEQLIVLAEFLMKAIQ